MGRAQEKTDMKCEIHQGDLIIELGISTRSSTLAHVIGSNML